MALSQANGIEPFNIGVGPTDGTGDGNILDVIDDTIGIGTYDDDDSSIGKIGVG